MHLQISARFTLKDKPKGYKGPSGAQYRFGQSGLSFFEMCASLINEVSEWYTMLEDADTLNQQKDALTQYVQESRFLPVEREAQ